MADADKPKDETGDAPKPDTETQADAAPEGSETPAADAAEPDPADATMSEANPADGPDTASEAEAGIASDPDAAQDGTRPSFAENRADDDGMAPSPDDEDAAATGESATLATGDHSVAPVEDGPSAQDELPAAPAESSESTDTIGSGPNTSGGGSGGPVGAATATAAGAAGPERVVERRGGFFPMVLGGIVAAIAGFALSQYLGPNGWPFSNQSGAFEDETRAALAETEGGLESLGTRIDGIETGLSDIDLTSVQDSVADLVDRTGTIGTDLTALTRRVEELGAEIEGLSAGLSAMNEDAGTLAERVTAIEKAPMEDAVSPETVAAYERELQELQSRVEDQSAVFEEASAERQAAMEEAFAEQQSQIEAQRAELQAMVEAARSAEAEAERQAELSQLRAAAGDLLTAVRTGDPYADALAPLADGMEIPEALSVAAEEGVPTRAALTETYPEAARDGLAAARAAGAGTEGDGNRLSAFMARQLNARSVTPRDGDSPDAILSRVEAAVNAGDLSTALDEIATLPEPAQEAMSEWTERARIRAEALAAAEGVVQQLNNE
ncbi:hypothetical protein ROJ8625_01028 [Roseivivax jejudonensis]|uniref:Mitochondrial inner membrane protein n=1 Tax=Roseivivax jejudonensis TaxID=1529041 RepID=A0A1X6YLH6_9RHOB|nr:hypothetical protein [Roseivivax jejudonensis]SLN24763.1 hypothetical protein ROJ8625_01028 [Roseivivax jejudonensis]